MALLNGTAYGRKECERMVIAIDSNQVARSCLALCSQAELKVGRRGVQPVTCGSVRRRFSKSSH